MLCKANLFRTFFQVESKHSRGTPKTYGQAKSTSVNYQTAKLQLLKHQAFSGWLTSDRSLENFSLTPTDGVGNGARVHAESQVQ